MSFSSYKKAQETQELQRKAKVVLKCKELLDARATQLITTISKRIGMSPQFVEHKIDLIARGMRDY